MPLKENTLFSQVLHRLWSLLQLVPRCLCGDHRKRGQKVGGLCVQRLQTGSGGTKQRGAVLHLSDALRRHTVRLYMHANIQLCRVNLFHLRKKKKTCVLAPRFYIGCDRCQNWYHGRCVGILQSEANHIDVYVCPQCQSTEDAMTVLSPLTDRDYEGLKRILRSLQV